MRSVVLLICLATLCGSFVAPGGNFATLKSSDQQQSSVHTEAQNLPPADTVRAGQLQRLWLAQLKSQMVVGAAELVSQHPATLEPALCASHFVPPPLTPLAERVRLQI